MIHMSYARPGALPLDRHRALANQCATAVEAPTPAARPTQMRSPYSERRAAGTHEGAAVHLVDPYLNLSADVLDDLERVRIANENRYRQLTRTEADSDGVERGFGLDETDADVARLGALVDALVKVEHDAELNLARRLRTHPLGPWVKTTKGVGAKQAARLLAAIGDPYWNDLHDRPRLVSELWSYAGYGDAQRQVRRRGERSNWSADAKMRTYLIAVSCIKVADSPYRKVYDAGRERYADAVHEVECRRCGPSGHPALVGSSLSDGHKHARAIRLMAKEILRDLWVEAKRLHEADEEYAAA